MRSARRTRARSSGAGCASSGGRPRSRRSPAPRRSGAVEPRAPAGVRIDHDHPTARAAGRRMQAMPISIVVPQLGESVAEGTVSRWLKAQGDKVRKEEPIVEIQTDKINVEIPSPAEGTLSIILIPEGTPVLVGT